MKLERNIALLILIISLVQAQLAPFVQTDYLNPKNSFFKLSVMNINNKDISYKDIQSIISCQLDGDNNRDLVFQHKNQLYLSQNIVQNAALNQTEIIAEGDYSLIQAVGGDSYQNVFAFSTKERKGYLFKNKFKNNLEQWSKQEVLSLSEIELQLKIVIASISDVKLEHSSKGQTHIALVGQDPLKKQHYIIRNHYALSHKTYEIIYQGQEEPKLLFTNFSSNEYLYSLFNILYDRYGGKYDLQSQIQQIFNYRDKDSDTLVAMISDNPYVVLLKKIQDKYEIVKTNLEYANYNQNQDIPLKQCLQFQFFDFFGKEARNYLCQMKNSFRFIFEFPMQKDKEQNQNKLQYSTLDIDIFSNEKSLNHKTLYNNQIIKLDHSILDGQIFLINSPNGLLIMQNTKPNFDDLWNTNFWFQLMVFTILLILFFGSIHFYCFGQRSLQEKGDKAQLHYRDNQNNNNEEDDDDDDDFDFDFTTRKNNRKTTI